MTNPNADLMGTLANDDYTAAHGEWLTGRPGPLPAVAAQAYRTVENALSQARMHANGARSRVEHLRGDDTLPEASRTRQVREALDQARATVTQQIDRADRAITVMRAVLTDEALPKVGRGNEMIARHDAQMILDRAKDPDQVMQAMRELAQRGDDVGALVASSWGRDYLTARGGTDPALFHSLTVDAAVDAAEQSSDPARQLAARHVRHLVGLEKARDAVMHGANGMLRQL